MFHFNRSKINISIVNELYLLPEDIEKNVLSYLNYQDLNSIIQDKNCSDKIKTTVYLTKKKILSETPWCFCAVYHYDLIEPRFDFFQVYLGSAIPKSFLYQGTNYITKRGFNKEVEISGTGQLYLYQSVGGPQLRDFLRYGSCSFLYFNGQKLNILSWLGNKPVNKKITTIKKTVDKINFGNLIDVNKVYKKKKRKRSKLELLGLVAERTIKKRNKLE